MPKETNIRVPPTGVSTNGVIRAIPISPYFFHSLTTVLFFFEKTGLFLENLSLRKSLNFLPNRVKTNTLDIVPATVIKIVSNTEYPAADPKRGPAINLK